MESQADIFSYISLNIYGIVVDFHIFMEDPIFACIEAHTAYGHSHLIYV